MTPAAVTPPSTRATPTHATPTHAAPRTCGAALRTGVGGICGALALALALLLPDAAAAQRVVPALGASLGATDLPRPLVESCTGDARLAPTLAVSVGAARGRLRAEVNGAAISPLDFTDCVIVPFFHPDGVHSDPIYDGVSEGYLSASAHLQYAPVDVLWLGLGAGRLQGAGAPFVLLSGTLRTRGRVALVAEAQARSTRLAYQRVTREWQDATVVRELGRERRTEWHRGLGLRMGAELRLR